MTRLTKMPAAGASVVIVGLLAACGGGGGSGSGSSGGVAGASTSANGATVTVTESDFKLAFSTMHPQPGPTTFVVQNSGKTAHSLEIDGPGVSDRRISGTIAPGSSRKLTVTLQHGTYEVYCPVDGHKGLGMDANLTVGTGSGAGAGAGTGGTTTTQSSGGGY